MTGASIIERHVIEVADRLLLERGELDAIECLRDLGLLDPASPHAGVAAPVESALLAPAHEVVKLLEQVDAYARAQRLTRIARTVDAAPAPGAPLTLVSHRLVELCHCTWRAADKAGQKDLFHDGASVAASNDFLDALAMHDHENAVAALERLRRLRPSHSALDDYGQLVRAATSRVFAAADQLKHLDAAIAPLARAYLGIRAQRYLTPLWSDLASALHGVDFAAQTPNLHASYAYACAEKWDDVALSIERQRDWSRHAVLVHRLAEARARQGRTREARRLWAELCWRHPDEADTLLLRVAGDPPIATLWRRFCSADAELAVEDFPAWLLVADERQHEVVPPEAAPDDAIGRAYAALHRVVTSGGELSARRALHALRPDLLGLYLARMESRGDQRRRAEPRPNKEQ